jgi:hypothetical protein
MVQKESALNRARCFADADKVRPSSFWEELVAERRTIVERKAPAPPLDDDGDAEL